MSGFNPTPTDGSVPPIPMSSAIVPGDKTPRPVRGGPAIVDSQGNTITDVAMYVYDGDNQTEGATTDAAVTGDVAGSLSAKIRGLSKILNDIWDSVNHDVHVRMDNATPLGQNTMVNSAPIVLPSDQVHSANTEGILPTNLLALAMYLLSGGGPVDSTGKPQQAAFDRLASWQGKGVGGASGNITSTLVGDTALVFSSAPKTIMPGAKIQLSVGAGAPVETVIVATSYVPSSSATSIPLQFPVVNASNTTAKWDVYVPGGPGTSSMLPTDMLPVILTALNNALGNPVTLITTYADGLLPGSVLATGPVLFNGSTDDKQRGNLDNISLVASAAYTTTQTSADQTNYNGRGVIVTLDVTTPGTGSITLEIDMKDPVSGKYVSLLTGAAVTTAVTNIYTVYPGAPATANVSANALLPRTWRVKVTANNANSITYSVGASVIV